MAAPFALFVVRSPEPWHRTAADGDLCRLVFGKHLGGPQWFGLPGPVGGNLGLSVANLARVPVDETL